MLICIVIIASTWKLLKASVRLSLDGVPENINLQKIKESALKINGVLEIHHLHIWAISTTENALTAHVVVAETSTIQETQRIKQQLKHELEHQNIQHATFETETVMANFEEPECAADSNYRTRK